MDLKTWVNRSRLNDFKSQLDYSVKKPKRPTFSEHNAKEQKKPNLNGETPNSFISSESKASDYSYYTNIQSFRNFSAMTQLKRSVSGAYSPLRSPQKAEKNVFSNAFDKMFPKNTRNSNEKKPLDEVLTSKMMDKAVNLIRKGRANNEEFSYCRKLRTACLLLLDNLNA